MSPRSKLSSGCLDGKSTHQRSVGVGDDIVDVLTGSRWFWSTSRGGSRWSDGVTLGLGEEEVESMMMRLPQACFASRS